MRSFIRIICEAFYHYAKHYHYTKHFFNIIYAKDAKHCYYSFHARNIVITSILFTREIQLLFFSHASNYHSLHARY